MKENTYWIIGFLLAGGLMYAGAKLYQPVLTALHVLVCLLLMLVVLLQSGRAADLAGAFGGAGSQTAFGPRGAATFLSKATTFLAVIFMATSMTLAIFASGGGQRSLAGQGQEPAAPTSEQTTPSPAESPPPEQPTPPPE